MWLSEREMVRGGCGSRGPCPPFLFLPFLTKSLYKVVSRKADHMLIITQSWAGSRVRRVRCLNAEFKETHSQVGALHFHDAEGKHLLKFDIPGAPLASP